MKQTSYKGASRPKYPFGMHESIKLFRKIKKILSRKTKYFLEKQKKKLLFRKIKNKILFRKTQKTKKKYFQEKQNTL